MSDAQVCDLSFDAAGRLGSDPHRSGCMESLTVTSDRRIVTSGGVWGRVRKGDTIRYVVDRTHFIRANGRTARAIVTGS